MIRKIIFIALVIGLLFFNGPNVAQVQAQTGCGPGCIPGTNCQYDCSPGPDGQYCCGSSRCPRCNPPPTSPPNCSASGRMLYSNNNTCIQGENTGTCELFYTKQNQIPPGSGPYSGKIQGNIGAGQRTDVYCAVAPLCGAIQVDIDLWENSTMTRNLAGGGVIDDDRNNPACIVTPTPSAPSCTLLNMNVTSPVVGSTPVTVRCHAGKVVHHANFRYQVNGGTWTTAYNQGGTNYSAFDYSFTANQAGTWNIQCQVCSSTDQSRCSTWGVPSVCQQTLNVIFPSRTPTPSVPTSTPTRPVTPTPTRPVTPTPTRPVTPTPTRPVTPTPTRRFTPTPTRRLTPTPTRRFTPTPTRRLTSTPTRRVTPTPTRRPTPTVPVCPNCKVSIDPATTCPNGSATFKVKIGSLPVASTTVRVTFKLNGSNRTVNLTVQPNKSYNIKIGTATTITNLRAQVLNPNGNAYAGCLATAASLTFACNSTTPGEVCI